MQRKCVQCYLMRSKLVQCPGGHSICTNFRLSNYSREDFIKIVLPHSASLYASKRALFAAFIVNYCANLLVLVSRIDESVPLFCLLLKFPCTIIFTFPRCTLIRIYRLFGTLEQVCKSDKTSKHGFFKIPDDISKRHSCL